MTNDRIARAVPGWSAERIEEKTGVRERRYLWDFDHETGRAIPPPDDDTRIYPANNSDMCEVALRGALEMSGIDGRELDAIFVVTCTPDELSFNHDAMELHRRFGCREDAFAFVIDDGCGGTPYTIDLARKMIEGGAFRTVAVVGSLFTSSSVNREVYTSEITPGPGRKPLSGYLSMYVFGDGAGAVVLQAGDEPGLVSSFAGNAHGELVLRRGGGAVKLPYQGRALPAEHAFIVDGMQVARSYSAYMTLCMERVLQGHPDLADQVQRYYFHQPNKRVMDHFVERSGLSSDRVAQNVDRYGNTSSAGMLILLAEDLANGIVTLGGNQLVMIAAIGANIHYGAQLFYL
ncbi:MAG TPA: 3-oxoacyl-[acyl-carrier-protein] synthase III C-terminal domain-containing protein [Myxococcaceae bacterium]|nr:3-oxoacyl-[acyl-carrier-protein] synthase III C-terminal domain-containing protein [Myxococcaceae bacterium]